MALREMENPTFANVMLTNKCNLNCNHCYVNKARSSRKPDEAVEMVRALKETGFQVGFVGAEVLMDGRYLPAFKEAGQQHILTNGTGIVRKPALLDEVRESGIGLIQVSYNFSIHELLGAQKKEVAMAAIQNSINAGFFTNVGTVLSGENYDQVPEICEQVKEIGANGVVFFPFIRPDREVTGVTPLSITQKQHVFSAVVDQRQLFDQNELGIYLFGTIGPRPGSKGERLAERGDYCVAGKEIFIATDNSVYACLGLTGQTDQAIGEYRDGKVFIEEEEMARIMAQDRSDCLARKKYNSED